MDCKVSKLQKNFPKDVDAIIVSSEINQYYLSGFRYTDGYLVIFQDKAFILCDFRYYEAAKNLSPDGFEIIRPEGSMLDEIRSLLSDHSAKQVGFEDLRLNCSTLERMKKAFEASELVPIGRAIESLREIKDPDEAENMIRAQRIAEKALDHIIGFISPDKTEIDVALELEFYMRKNGAEAASFEIIAVSGTSSSLPHGVPRNVRLEKGFFTLDFGAVYNGYCSDMTRTICIGKADAEMKKIYDTVLNAQLAAIAQIKPGMTGKEADGIARKIIEDAGYGKCFGHSLGHSVGIEIHESPNLSPKEERNIVPGNVVTVEPGIYIEGNYGVRIEDMGIITESGYSNFTKAPKELIEL